MTITPAKATEQPATRAWKSFLQQPPREKRDQDWPHVDEHRRRARIHSLLGLVQGQVVEPEPEDAADDDARPLAATGQPASLKEDEDAEQGASDREPPQAQRARRQVLACRPDPHEGGRPQDHGDDRCDEGT
jgi:hypothetical protein